MFRKSLIFLCLFVIFTLVSGTSVFAYEENQANTEDSSNYSVDDIIETYAINYFTVSFKKTSNTKAKAYVTARTTTTSKAIESKITLQKYNSSTKKYVNQETRPKTAKALSIVHEEIFTINSSGTYRIKVVLDDGATEQIKYQALS